jgi:predicted nucleotidyltransferase
LRTPSNLSPTPYEDINKTLHFMLSKIQNILGKKLVGFYLYGSLSLGDFDPDSSDVDFLVVTADTLSTEEFEQLRAMHAEIAASNLPYALHLEGSYIPLVALRKYDPQNDYHPTIGSDWDFQIGVHGSRWIFERHIVREQGVVVYGPPPETLIDPVSPEDIRWAVCHTLRGFWSEQIKEGEEPEWLRGRDYQAFAILTLCRALHTLKHGTLLSKPQAAAWARQQYPAWQPIIDRALSWRSQHEPDDMMDMLAFLREAIARGLQECPE